MKKIKLFALAAFAMLSTNVFAAIDGKSATKVFTFEYTGENATITGFVADLDDEFKTAVAIPETVTHPTLKNSDGTPKKYFVTGIGLGEDGKAGFIGEPIETITFPAAVPEDDYKGVASIEAGVFKGTKIKSLDLTNTLIKTVGNYFGTVIAEKATDDVVNATLTSVTLPATATAIAEKAFENCTKLATVNMSAATELASIGAYAFAGCPLKALDLSKNAKVKNLVAKTLYDGARYKSSTALTTVTLHQAFTALNNNLQGAAKLTTVTGHIYTSPSKKETTAFTALLKEEFKGCAALTTFETKSIKTFGNSCFDGCASLATASLESATSIGTRAFAGTALTSVTFPAANAGLTTISDQAFFECENLTEVTLAVASKATTINTIGKQAFAYTGITEFTIPEPETNEKFVIGEKAFAGTPITSFTWNSKKYDGTNQKIATDVFSKCSGVTFYTTTDFIEAWRDQKGEYAEGGKYGNGPTNSTFSTETVDLNIKFTTTAYSNNPKKFYVKWYSDDSEGKGFNIQVKRSDCKVYAGFLEGDGSLAMIQYKADDKGLITILKNDAALIVTANADLTYVKGGTKTGSWMPKVSAKYTANEELEEGQNALKYCTGATTRGTLENQLKNDSYYIYGWMKAGGFQKIASGTTIPEGTLFAFAKEPVDGARMTVKWYDENGNLEAETTAIDAEATAINGVKAAEAEGQRYNVAGQKVSAAYKGLVIKDGKKYMQK